MASLEGLKSELKGILKTPQAAADQAARHRQIAVQHATILQHRKDLEASILNSLIILSTYPDSPSTTASRPATSDTKGFRTHIRLFQSSDYDELVEERNVNGLCGYTLCPERKRDTGPGGEWTIRNGHIVPRKEIEMWCSNACKKRAMYVKIQLGETAAWERAGLPDINIDLLEEESDTDKATNGLANLKLEDKKLSEEDQAALALERGDRVADPTAVKVTLKEKEHIRAPTTAPNAPFEEEVEDDMTDGYRVKFGQLKLNK